MVSKSKSVKIFTTIGISVRNIFKMIGGLVRLFETIFKIFISLKHFLVSAALSWNKIRKTEVILTQTLPLVLTLTLFVTLTLTQTLSLALF